jgi:hypothetical protein
MEPDSHPGLAVATQAVISAIGAQLLLAQIAIAYAVTYIA